MIKRAYFDTYDGDGWPDIKWLETYFLTEAGRQRFFASGNDSWGLKAYGLGGSEKLPPSRGRIDVDLTILGHRDLGILLCYYVSDGLNRKAYYSKGNVERLGEWVETFHGDKMPVGLYVPFDLAWLGVKEFIEKEGELPQDIPWFFADDLPVDTFPSG